MHLTGIEIRHKDFSVTFSLSDVFEIEHFVAREEELAEMHRTFSGNSSCCIIVLYSLGGISKTQLTVAYMKQHKDSYSAVFWLNIKDKDSLKQSFAKVAKQILKEHPLASWLNSVDVKENLDKVIDAVKAWLSLSKNTRWLIVYNNYNNPKLLGNVDQTAVDICQFLPEAHQGSIIITTRLSQVKIGHHIQVEKLEDIQDSLEILSHMSEQEKLMEGKLHSAVIDVELTR
jgi:hypothetical protein